MKAVIDKLDANNLIGNLEDSKPYIFGEIEMYSGVLMRRSSIFFTDNTFPNLLLFGSSYNLLGNRRSDSNDFLYNHHSLMVSFMRLLHEYEQENSDYFEKSSYDYDRITRLISILKIEMNEIGHTQEKLKFVARKYKSIKGESEGEFIIGSPIFVSLSNK